MLRQLITYNIGLPLFDLTKRYRVRQYYEFYNGLVSMSDGAFGSIYYGLIGLHGLHCVTGEIMIIFTGIRLFKYEYDEENHNNI